MRYAMGDGDNGRWPCSAFGVNNKKRPAAEEGPHNKQTKDTRQHTGSSPSGREEVEVTSDV